MNRNAIASTALCKYDAQQGSFIVQSPLFERCIGAASTEEGARETFKQMLNEYYVAYLEGTLVGYSRRGRPAKGNVEFHAQIKPKVKRGITQIASELGISQGEVVDYLFALHQNIGGLEHQTKATKKKHANPPARRKRA